MINALAGSTHLSPCGFEQYFSQGDTLTTVWVSLEETVKQPQPTATPSALGGRLGTGS